ncbi:hypothetical protein NDA11_006515 [Ustilago hordei]|uniref:Uncharacterized protein n=1 Tax=Ustilago hordei TaxID=120017 RepID=I2FYY7_USTHO|nr:uncharacterized protein UHO2_06813 [Ustilago hordei]KAJ1584210.1 hypothetical protein NDA11_006515 [Ustilago hordei]KAJ1599108.1 hypothetical protein NDA14_002031 [Ustilago hordei]UTT91235.1 hypothetical protein NDA17_002045 [Ustilago hordei]CCF52130.1 uncharacterized protein UHOR_03678 [Ustilago hordei]SYW83599.1 uncharacterized protein UHO2_06813 [Ustilago hordei]
MKRVLTLILVFLLLFALTLALPPRHARLHKFKHKRQLEEELLVGAEDSVELFDHPRIHDTSEKIHEAAEQKNITVQHLEEIKRKKLRKLQILMLDRKKFEQENVSERRRLKVERGGEGG